MKSPARDILTLLIRVTFAFLPLIASGETERHVVQRGETWWSICRDYGVEFEQLQQHNRWLESDSPCIAGLEVDVPLVGADGDRLLLRLHATDSRYVEALSLYDAGEYKKAVKACDKIIKNDVGPYAAIFLRGRAQLMRGKYGKAIDDFNSAGAISFSSLDDLRSQAFELKVEQDERRAAMWGGIAIGVAAAAVTTAAVIAAESDDSGSAYSSMSMPYAGVADGYIAPSTGSNLSPGRILDNGTVITPAGNVIRPPESFQKMMNGEYNTDMQVTYDKFGNPMFSSEGTARMAEDIARDNMNIAQGMLANNPNSAIAQSYAIQTRGDMARAMQTAQYFRTPHYAPDAETMKEINADMAAENDRRRKERMEERERDRRDLIERNKAMTEAMLNHTTPSSSSTSGASSTYTAPSRTSAGSSSTKTYSSSYGRSDKNSSGSYGNKQSERAVSPKDDDNLDSKQQFKTEKVSSDDYQEIKKVNVYFRDGNSCHVQ